MLNSPALPLVLGVVAFLLIAIPAWMLLSLQQARERGVAGSATIVEREDRPFAGSFHCWVEFAGRRFRLAVNQETWRTLRPGEALAIRYDPEKPGEIHHGEPRKPLSWTLLWCLVLIAGIATAVAAWRLWFRD